MKCKHCGSEWMVSESFTKNIESCPFCGEAMTIEPPVLETMDDVLAQICKEFGTDVLRDGTKLLSIFADMAPKLKRERTILRYFVECNGNEVFVEAIHLEPNETRARIRSVMDTMKNDLQVSDAAIQQVCRSFWHVIGGSENGYFDQVSPLQNTYIPNGGSVRNDRESATTGKYNTPGLAAGGSQNENKGCAASKKNMKSKVVAAIGAVLAVVLVLLIWRPFGGTGKPVEDQSNHMTSIGKEEAISQFDATDAVVDEDETGTNVVVDEDETDTNVVVDEADEKIEIPTQPDVITDVWLEVWAPMEDQVTDNSWLIAMEKAFAKAHPEYNITWGNGVCPEGDAATMVAADPSAAADVYMFANDQLGTLVRADGLTKLSGSYLEQVKNDVSATYINTVTSTDGNVYGFPVAPNTWFMYYNKSILSEKDVKSLEACLKKGIVAFDVKNSWYLPSFFFAAGGSLFGETGADAAAGIKFGGEVGYNATNAVLDLLENPNFKIDGDGYGNAGLKDGSVVAYFSGSWDYAGLYDALGENLGAVAAPTVNINGKAAQLKAYAGSRAIGVNPNAKNQKAAMQFAAFLASADSQLLRFQLRNITPAVTALAENADVAASIVAVAESNTMAFASVAQPSIAEMNPVWGPVGTFGTNIADGMVTRDNVVESVDALDAQLKNGW